MSARFVGFAVLVVATTVGSAARAEGSGTRAVRAAVLVQQQAAYTASQPMGLKPVSLEAPVPLLALRPGSLVLTPPSSVEPSEAPPKKRAEPTGCAPGVAKCAYRALLAGLVITRDLEIPGAPGMAVRLIPTRSALAGETRSPVVFRPHVVGTGFYGLDVAAKF